jgi:hypothetical protein
MRTATQVGQQQHFQQHLQHFKMVQTPPGPGVTQPGPSNASPWFSRSGSGGSAPAAAAGADAGAPWQQETQQQEPQQQSQQQQGQQQQAPLLTADSDVYQGLLDSKVLSEPKKAAQAAWDQWQLGRSIAQIATEGRDKPIQVCVGSGDAWVWFGTWCVHGIVQQRRSFHARWGSRSCCGRVAC